MQETRDNGYLWGRGPGALWGLLGTLRRQQSSKSWGGHPENQSPSFTVDLGTAEKGGNERVQGKRSGKK